MFNPYVGPVEQSLRQTKPPKPAPGPPEKSQSLGAVLDRLSSLDRDDVLIALLIFLLARDQETDSLWPMVAAGIYLLL
jgi:hypothetical protein